MVHAHRFRHTFATWAIGRDAELGGAILVGPETVADTGLVFANVQDPDGNHFGLICPPAR